MKKFILFSFFISLVSFAKDIKSGGIHLKFDEPIVFSCLIPDHNMGKWNCDAVKIFLEITDAHGSIRIFNESIPGSGIVGWGPESELTLNHEFGPYDFSGLRVKDGENKIRIQYVDMIGYTDKEFVINVTHENRY